MKATKVTDMVCVNVSECRPVKKDFRTFVNTRSSYDLQNNSRP